MATRTRPLNRRQPQRCQAIIDEFCDFALCVGIFQGRQHDIQQTVDAAWIALRKRAGTLYGKYGGHYANTLRQGFVDLGGNPLTPR